MAGKFSVIINALKMKITDLEQTEERLTNMEEKLETVRSDISFGKGTHAVKEVLELKIKKLDHDAKSVHKLKETLEDVCREYQLAEARITNNVLQIQIVLHEKDLDKESDKEKEEADKRKAEEREKKKKEENVIDRITDDDTRNGFSEDYKKALQRIYDDVPTEYSDAKKLYDKYSKDVKVVEFDAVTKNKDGTYSPTAFTREGEIHLNTDEAMNDPRGIGESYYHEYGHYIVYKENWIQNGQTTGKFKEFEETLKKEANQYIDNKENNFEEWGRDELKLSGSKLENYVETETRKSIERDLRGENDENYYVYDGISDIIDGASKDKYQASYGHNPNDEGISYWDVNSTRFANEAFANIYTAQMNGDTKELEKIQEMFPETYEIYMELISEAAN